MKNIEKAPILAVETSGELCGASVYFNEQKFADYSLNIKNVHSGKIISLVDSALSSVELKLRDLSAVAISTGPGSFTGLRIGMSAVKGLALGCSLPVIPVPTFDALALQISQYLPEGTEFVIANKVNVDEVYYSAFIAEGEYYKNTEPLVVMPGTDLPLRAGTRAVFGSAKIAAMPQIRTIASPQPRFVGKWAYIFGKDLLTYEYDFLEPVYLKNFVIKEAK